MRAFLLLVKLRLLDVLRRPSTGFFILLLPVLLLLLIGGIFANGHPFERHRVSVIWPSGAASGGTALTGSIAGLPGVRVIEERAEAAARGSLQSRMTDAVFIAGPDGGRLLVRSKDELFGRGLAAALAPAGGVALEIVEAPRWGYLHYLVPGMLALTVVLTGLYGMGYTMVRYRSTGFLKKLSTTPLSRASFIGSQITGRAALALAQTILLLLAARLVFGLPLSAAAFGWMLALTTIGLLTFMGAGFALASLLRAEDTMQDIINAVTGPLVLLSEVFFSAEELPGPLPAVASALPSTQLVRLSRAVLLQGEVGAAALLPGVAVMGLWLVGTFGVSLLVFRWND